MLTGEPCYADRQMFTLTGAGQHTHQLSRMNVIPLSPETQRRLEAVFAADERAEATKLLVNECGTNLPFLDKLDMFQLERYRFAALRLSDGKLDKLRQAVDLAQCDWRDLLMAAGFGENVTEHERWFPPSRAG
jgi:hypothetical protein